MKTHFHNRIRTDTMTPMWLEQKVIAGWMAKKIKEEKARRAMALQMQRVEAREAAGARRGRDTSATGLS